MLPKTVRLRRSRDFQAVYRVRKSWATPHLALHVRYRGGDGTESPVRLGFVISKKVAKRAHDRNRLKRRLREICRAFVLPRRRPGRGWDALFIARSSAPSLDFAGLIADVESLSRQAGLLSSQSLNP